MKAAFLTLGCKVNQYETQAMEDILKEHGHTIVPFAPGADAYIINTCSVTSTGDKKSRNAVRKARRMGPCAIVAVCGCYSQLCPDKVSELGADLVGGSSERRDFVEKLEKVFLDRQKTVSIDEPFSRREFEILPPGGMTGRTRAMLKVQDGCTNFCTYCVIPFSRGAVRSITVDDALEQTQTLKNEGYKEIVLTGIEIASWGRDLEGKPSPRELFAAICRQAGDARIRLGSLEPRIVDEDFCRELSRYKNLCPQFHLSMQSGCDETLKRMGRKYDTERFFRSVSLLKEYFPGCAVTTDMITGFPGEDEEEFAKSLAFIEKCAFSAMHIFPYSEREGTKAASFPGRVPIKEREERALRASAVAKRMHEDYLRSLVGSVQDVLYETVENGVSKGHAPNYVLVSCEGEFSNTVVPTRITGVEGDRLTGEAIN
ncbi:MAG: tRNA (N(6)-L-threonylcarbamoyladenosine(37)-C(2))-methylthiotransferase MtaB [Oscillospiraceae bacterium]|nr:tRNA (N(6)-L-threonylcarbamoyladenosine(37)-C(2))-methylthiotransferase MtaB [Oscillospiraceae bacterium]